MPPINENPDSFRSHPNLQFLGSVHATEFKDFSIDDSYPIHIKNKHNPKVCEISMSDDTFRFTISGNNSKWFEVKLEIID